MKLANTNLKFLQVIADAVDNHLRAYQKWEGKKQPIEENKEILFRMKHGLSKITPGKQFTPRWVNSDSSYPFIMGIYPDLQELSEKSKLFLQYLNKGDVDSFLKEWNGFTKWNIEVDTRLVEVGNPICVDDGRQFVALCCHEVGHAMIGNPTQLIKNFVYQKQLVSKLDTLMLSSNVFVHKFVLPMFVCTLPFRLILHCPSGNIRDEIGADHFVPQEYRADLVTYMEHHVLNNPEATRLVVSKEDFDQEQQVAIKFSRETIRMMKTRRNVLKASLKAQYEQGCSKYMANMVLFLAKMTMGYDPEKDETNEVYEQSMLRCYDMDMESCEKKATAALEAANVTPRDISILEVQADDISTVDQKLFLVHTCYDFLEILQAQRKKILTKTPEAKNLPQDKQIAQINDILSKIMKKDVSGTNDRFGLFIKYPTGYEG